MGNSEFSRAVKSLETVKNIHKYLPTFYDQSLKRKKSKHLAWSMLGVPPEILAAFDLPSNWPENYGTLCAAKLVSTKFIEAAEADGYTNELCSYVMNTLGYCSRYKELNAVPPEAPMDGGIGAPSMMLGAGWLCDPRYKWFQTIATRYMPAPVFSSDPLSPPFDANMDDPRIKNHYVTSMRKDLQAQITFIEEQTGMKFDRDKFRELLRRSLLAENYWYKALELCKAVPAPMGAADYFTAIIPQIFMLGTEEAVNFYKALYEEVKNRVDNKIGIIKEEKHRLIWMGLPPWFNLGLFNYLERHGVTVPVVTIYYPCKPVAVDLSDPVEALIERTWGKALWLHDQGAEALSEIMNMALTTIFVGRKKVCEWVSEYKLSGAIMHRTKTCRAGAVGELHYQNVLREMGIPSLVLESDMADPRKWSDAKIKGMIEAYLESIDQRKKQ